MGKDKVVFFCKECGHESPRWLGKCPGCGVWNTFVEEKVRTTKDIRKVIGGKERERITPIKLNEVKIKEDSKYVTGFNELDRVLGGGLVRGSLVLVGGEPGIGKSTLILQVCDNLAKNGKVLYISGEESDIQIKMRADRLNVKNENIMFLGETDIQNIEDSIVSENPKIVIVDSIQTIYNSDISSIPGSVSQVREVTAKLMMISKQLGITILVIRTCYKRWSNSWTEDARTYGRYCPIP